MGIHGIYKEIGPGRRIAFSKLSLEKFEETGRPLRIAIDVSIWLFQIQASKGGTNPALRTFYYRLLRLIALSIHPIFVFDGPDKPPFKRGKRTGPNVASVPEFLAKQLLKQFGFPIHLAPGEAEAECALLQREGIVDVVLSEDVDTLMFGSGVTVRNWSPELKTGKTPTHVNVYDAAETKSGPSQLDREGMILVALMSGGDYVPEGIPGCGPKTACEAARAGFGHDLCNIRKGDSAAVQRWRERLQHELKSNENKLFKRKHTTLVIPDDFPRADILGYYTHPVVSTKAGLDKLRRSIKWDQDLDFPGLREFANDAFDWVKLEGAKHFIRSLAPSLLVRSLRMRADSEQFSSDDLVARQKHEATLVKGIHGKRQHAITDNTPEVRISFIPLDLVKIDLSNEEPDEELDFGRDGLAAGGRAESPEMDEEMELDADDGEAGPRKRGPTKFDASKPARAWVAETLVQIGVPLAFEDWRAGTTRPKAASTKPRLGTATAAAKSKTSKRTKPTAEKPQRTIDQFARVTKPGVRTAQKLAKVQDPPQQPRPLPRAAEQAAQTVINLLSSSPVKPLPSAVPSETRLKSLSPLPELPPSVTKRRRRGPMQRSQTLPADMNANGDRPATPSKLDTIETLDLIDSPALPSPSELPVKRPRTRTTRNPPPSQPKRANSIASTPTKTRQTTLDLWSRSPTKSRKLTPPREASPTPKARHMHLPEANIDTLDLTLSSPLKPIPIAQSKQPERTRSHLSTARPPLQSINSNTSFTSTSSSDPQPKKANPKPSRASPRLRNRPPAQTIDTLDLTGLCSSPLPVPNESVPPPPAPAPTTLLDTPPPPKQSLRRSPRLSSPLLSLPSPPHPTTSTSTSTTTVPTAAWKSANQKKRIIQLRKSLAGAWTFADQTSDNEDDTPNAKWNAAGAKAAERQRRRWRESQIESLDLT
ncbi:hypothetical protein BU24DRAFT_382758 [Aaosphaeria arxii CBS 175.79]|uniref:Flap structure-specific endonuclease n=1 Tax=Aaosphaeria arxii CBS 175.79 TaxID=1450172 RepID=A0A6A5Y664_9PLEO|nr:uncharacterized protein BU24DRAFT_382758 [Aaosphaeria arxii CBS 175.79]KAF2020786.1 hypothetical protein BU24DRAFT_382758 [Aaosphaeria arxii CBS 175.79]